MEHDFIAMYGEDWAEMFALSGAKYRCTVCGARGYLDPHAQLRADSWVIAHLTGHAECPDCGKTVTKRGLRVHRGHHHRRRMRPAQTEYQPQPVKATEPKPAKARVKPVKAPAKTVQPVEPEYNHEQTEGPAMTQMQTIGGLERLLTKEEVCELLGVKLAWLNTEIQGGRFPYTRLGEKKNIRFTPDQIRGYLATRASTWTPPNQETMAG